MTTSPPTAAPRFPWVYAIIALTPGAMIAGTGLAWLVFEPNTAMSVAMGCATLIGPLAVLTLGWGVVRMLAHKGRQHPALLWLVLLQLLFVAAGALA